MKRKEAKKILKPVKWHRENSPFLMAYNTNTKKWIFCMNDQWKDLITGEDRRIVGLSDDLIEMTELEKIVNKPKKKKKKKKKNINEPITWKEYFDGLSDIYTRKEQPKPRPEDSLKTMADAWEEEEKKNKYKVGDQFSVKKDSIYFKGNESDNLMIVWIDPNAGLK